MVLATSLGGSCLMMESGFCPLESADFRPFLQLLVPWIIVFSTPGGPPVPSCFPKGAGSYLQEAGLCQISENFSKYLAWNWEGGRFSNQSAKLSSLILALQLTELFMGGFMLTIFLHPQGSEAETDKITAGGGKDCLTPVALSSESRQGVLSEGLLRSPAGTQIAPAGWHTPVPSPCNCRASPEVS